MSLPDFGPQATRRNAAELVAHLQSFELDLKFSAGVWFFSPPASRFHDRYGPVIEIEPRLEIASATCGSRPQGHGGALPERDQRR